MFWEICEVCKKIFKMETRVCLECQKEVFRCVLCDEILTKRKGIKICLRCRKKNPFLCPVCLEVYSAKDFGRLIICRRCLKLKIPYIYPEYVETKKIILNDSAHKVKLLKKIMAENNIKISGISEALEVSKGKIYGWLYCDQGVEASMKEIENIVKST